MNPRQTELLLRRKQLRIKIATQRLHIAQIAQPWQEPLHKADRVLDTLRSLRRHPALLAVLAGMAGTALAPGRTGRVAQSRLAGMGRLPLAIRFRPLESALKAGRQLATH